MIPAGGLNVGWVDDTGLGSGSSGTLGCCFSQGVTRELDPVGVVYEAVEDRVSIGRVVDEFMPTSHRQLTGHQRRAPHVAVLEDFQQMVAVIAVQRCQAPVIEDEQINPGQAQSGSFPKPAATPVEFSFRFP